MARHNDLHYGVADLAGKAFTPAHVRDNPKIFTSCDAQGGKSKSKGKTAAKGKEATPPGDGEEKGGLLIQDIWTQGTDSIHDMCAGNTDAVSYQSKTPEKCLETAEREKKSNYLNA